MKSLLSTEGITKGSSTNISKESLCRLEFDIFSLVRYKAEGFTLVYWNNVEKCAVDDRGLALWLLQMGSKKPFKKQANFVTDINSVQFALIKLMKNKALYSKTFFEDGEWIDLTGCAEEGEDIEYKGRFGDHFELRGLGVHARFMTSEHWTACNRGVTFPSMPERAALSYGHELLAPLGADRPLKGPQSLARSMVAVVDRTPESDRYGNEAFYGGMFEVRKAGRTKVPTWKYDIVSAYPKALLRAPAISADKESVKVAKFASDLKWDIDLIDEFDDDDIISMFVEFSDDEPPYPLPYRFASSVIGFPQCVRGSYFGFEVKSALRRAPIKRIRIFEIAHVDKAEGAAVGSLFKRAMEIYEAADRGTFERNVLKKLCNACWGTLAKQKRDSFRGDFGSSHWHAAWVTAKVRVSLQELMRKANQNNVILAATDGVYVTERIEDFNLIEFIVREREVPPGTLFFDNGWSIEPPGVEWNCPGVPTPESSEALGVFQQINEAYDKKKPFTYKYKQKVTPDDIVTKGFSWSLLGEETVMRATFACSLARGVSNDGDVDPITGLENVISLRNLTNFGSDLSPSKMPVYRRYNA
jgi:hypothetical protein